jgi:hypothetical protein
MKTMLTPTNEHPTQFVRCNTSMTAHFARRKGRGCAPHHRPLCRKPLKMCMDFVTLATLGSFFRPKRKTPPLPGSDGVFRLTM